MTTSIDGLGSQLAPVSPVPVKAPSAPAQEPDLRDTQQGVTTAQESDGTANTETHKDLEAAINDRLARLLRSNIRMSIDVDKGSGRFVYKSIDKQTGDVDRQWPAETILRMLAFFRELDGLLYDKKV